MPTNIRSAWPQVVGQAWADEEFRRRLLENPRRVLDELGVEIPADHRVELLEDTHAQTFLVLPRKPEHLDALASANGASVRSGFRADACTNTPAEKPFACTNTPAEKPFACTNDPKEKPFACTNDPKEKPFACTNAPNKP